jgi:thioredoxin 1
MEIIMTSPVTDTNFAHDVLASSQPVVVDFWAEWCGPCKMIAPHLEELSTEFQGKVKILKLNTDENQQTAIRYGVRSIPTLILFKNGEEVDRKVGAGPKSDLQRWIQNAAA